MVRTISKFAPVRSMDSNLITHNINLETPIVNHSLKPVIITVMQEHMEIVEVHGSLVYTSNPTNNLGRSFGLEVSHPISSCKS